MYSILFFLFGSSNKRSSALDLFAIDAVPWNLLFGGIAAFQPVHIHEHLPSVTKRLSLRIGRLFVKVFAPLLVHVHVIVTHVVVHVRIVLHIVIRNYKNKFRRHIRVTEVVMFEVWR